MNVIGYARVSTKKQAEDEPSLEQQVTRLRDAGAEQVYADVLSREFDDRKGLLKVLELIEMGEVDRVLVTRTDRLSGSASLMERLVNLSERTGVVFKALDENLDLATIDGEFSALIQAVFSRRERKMIKLRVLKGLEHRKNEGKPHKAPFAYKEVKGKLVLDKSPFLSLLTDKPRDWSHDWKKLSDEELVREQFVGKSRADVGRDLVDLFFQRKTLEGTLKVFNEKYGIQRCNKKPSQEDESLAISEPEDSFMVFDFFKGNGISIKKSKKIVYGVLRWSRDGLRKWLLNPCLEGHTPYGTRTGNKNSKRRARDEWDIIYNTHPEERLISEQEAQAIRKLFTENSKLGGFVFREKKLPLSGLVFCGECGSKCVNQGNPHRYYQCSNSKLRACANKKNVRADKIEQEVVNRITEFATGMTNLIEELDITFEEPTELKELRIQLSGLEAIPGDNKDIEKLKQKIRCQIEVMEQKLKTKNRWHDTLIEQANRIAQQPNFWEKIEGVEKGEIFRDFVSQVVIKDGVIQNIKFKS